jgi:uncharacterized membrane protein
VARLNDDAQWIILIGFVISFSLFFLAVVINQSTVVGQTTAESVSEFPKNDIRDVRSSIIYSVMNGTEIDYIQRDISVLSLARKNAIVEFTNTTPSPETKIMIHYNNGVTTYNEIWTSF